MGDGSSGEVIGREVSSSENRTCDGGAEWGSDVEETVWGKGVSVMVLVNLNKGGWLLVGAENQTLLYI